MGRNDDIIRWCEKIINDYPEEQKEAILIIANCYHEADNIKMCMKTLAQFWQVNNRSFKSELMKDKRFDKMFAYILEKMKGNFLNFFNFFDFD